VGFTEAAKCMKIAKIFDDAYRSQMSCVLVDSLERLLDYGPIGPRYSNLTLQALLVLLKKNPPKGRRLLIICTTSRKEVLDQMEMLSVFTDVLHVSNLSTAQHVGAVLDQNDTFNKQEVATIVSKLKGYSICIGVKKLLGLLDMVKQMEPKGRLIRFLNKLEEENFAVPSGTAM